MALMMMEREVRITGLELEGTITVGKQEGEEMDRIRTVVGGWDDGIHVDALERVGGEEGSTGGGEKVEAVVLVHGLLHHKDGGFLPELAAEMAGRFGVVVRITCRGNKGSGGSWKLSGYMDDVEDMVGAGEVVERALGVDVVALVGHSRGANAVVLAGQFLQRDGDGDGDGDGAQKLDKLRSVVAISPRRVMSVFTGKYFTTEERAVIASQGSMPWKAGRVVTQEDLAVFDSMDMEGAYTACIGAGLDVTVIHGDEDEIIPFSDSAELPALCPGVTFVPITHANHSYTTPDTGYADLIASVLSSASPPSPPSVSSL